MAHAYRRLGAVRDEWITFCITASWRRKTPHPRFASDRSYDVAVLTLPAPIELGEAALPGDDAEDAA